MATAFYGTMSIATSVIGDPAFKSLWDATLDGYDEARLTYGITSVYGSDEEGGRTVYQVSGIKAGTWHHPGRHGRREATSSSEGC